MTMKAFFSYAESREMPDDNGISDQNKSEIGLAVILVFITVGYFVFKYIKYGQQRQQPPQYGNDVAKKLGASGSRSLKVCCWDRKRRVGILAENFTDFDEKCRLKFQVTSDISVTYVLDSDGTEVDGDYFESIDKDLVLMILKKGEVWKARGLGANGNSGGDAPSASARELEANENSGDAAPSASEKMEIGSDYVDLPQASLSEAAQNIEAENKKGTIQALADRFQQLRMPGAKFMPKTLEDELEKWKKVSIDIAVTGESGSGKSSLINSMRGITADDKGGAKVGSIETTTKCQEYPHPTNQNLVFWDLPGVGTPKFPKESYITDVKLDKYDFFIIVSQGRVTENDIWLAKCVLEQDKKFYFIRSKADNEVRDDRKGNPKSHDAKRLMDDIRNDCTEKLRAGGITNPQVFVLNSHNQNEYDYQIFELAIISEAPHFKRDALVLAFPAMNHGVINEKKAVLASRKWKIAIRASLASAVPIPGPGLAFGAAALVEEGRFYCEQLGIDEKSITKMAKMMNVSVEELRKRWGLKVFQIVASPRAFVKYMGQLLVPEYLETAKIYFPIIGSVIATGISYRFCVYSLQTTLNMCVAEALLTRLKFTTWINGETTD